MAEPTDLPDVIVKSDGAFLMLADQSAVVNHPSFWSSTLGSSQRAAAIAELTKRNDVFVWTMVLDGTFRIQFRIHRFDPRSHPYRSADEFILNVPTGGLVVRSSRATVEVTSVPPGVYAGTLRWDLQQESDHSSIESVEMYPKDDGPDGVIELWCVG
jgi:hypothetical protein